MITIICGENTAESREYYNSLKKQYLNKGYEIRTVNAAAVADINLWLADSPSLFGVKRVFFCEHLNKFIRRENKKLADELKLIDGNKEIELIDWEAVSQWELKLKKIGKVKEFKPDQNIFKLQEGLFPGNKDLFINRLGILAETEDANFIFIMLVRYVKNLILVKENINPPGVQSWQIYKLKAQADRWNKENLIGFYESLFKIEIGLKTGSNPFKVKESLEILAFHYL